MSLDLARRSGEREWLDDADPPVAELAVVLRDLARLNGLMLGRALILRWLARALRRVPRDEPVTLLDIGCGYGDLLRAIRRWARRRGREIGLCGIDLNGATVAIARAATPADDRIEYRVANGLALAPAQGADFIVSSLLAHHLSNAEIERFLRAIEGGARRGWLVCDLVRHRLPYHAIGVAGGLLRVHPVVVSDGRLSVARALTRGEWRARLAAAGMPQGAVRVGAFLFRHMIGREK